MCTFILKIHLPVTLRHNEYIFDFVGLFIDFNCCEFLSVLVIAIKFFKIIFILQLSYEIIPIPSAPLVFGESPHWDSCSDSLFYTDILGTNFSIFRYDYYEGRVYPARIPNAGAASFIIPLKCCKNVYAVGLGRFVNVIKWNGKSQFAKIVRNITAVEQADAYSTNTIHTAKADAKGRLFFGTFRQGLCSSSSAPSGSLYSYSKKHGTRRVLGDINIPSGMAWNEDDKKFYLVNTCKFTLDEYNWNPKTGKISKSWSFGFWIKECNIYHLFRWWSHCFQF